MSLPEQVIPHSAVSSSSARAWLICITAGLFFFYEFIQMNMLSSLNQDLMQVYRIQATDLGMLSSCYFIANVIFLFPAGQLLDRFSTRKIMLVSMGICVLGTFGFALADSLFLASVFRFLTGIGSAFCFLSCIRLASRWFPARRMALVSGLVVTMAMLGGWVAQEPFTRVIELAGWRQAILLDGLLGIIIMGMIFAIVRDCPSAQVLYFDHQKKHLTNLGYWRSVSAAYLRKQNWLGGIYTSMMNLPVFLMGATWGSLYLEQIHHFTRNEATNITGMIFFGTVIGSPLAGWISDKLGRRKLPMLVGTLLSMVLVLIIMYVPNMQNGLLQGLFFLLGLITSAQVISYPMIAESNPLAITAMSVSVISFSTIGGGAVLIPFFGRLMDSGWSHTLVNGIPIYAATDYKHAMLIMPIAFVVAFVAAFMLKETYCKKME
ncbi:MAG: MFS transporter [Legionellales bacterium]|nr:MFS transporter [Legionellales bacterium]